MKITDLTRIIESKKITVLPVEWPTNLARRIQFKGFSKVDPLCDLRKNKVFAIPFRNWLGTYWSLTGKDLKKIPYMPTQIVEISDDTMVADMEVIDTVFGLRNKDKSMTAAAQNVLDSYINDSISYGKFKQNPFIFSKPEILIDKEKLKILSGHVVLSSEIDIDEATPTPLLGIK